jgi:hypothetical protein
VTFPNARAGCGSPSAPLYRAGVDDDEPPICPVCGVTMVPAALSARDDLDGAWVCLECEETGASDEE